MEQQIRYSVDGYHMGFSNPKHGFESCYRSQEEDTAQGAKWGLKFCLRSSVGLEQSTVNR